jgi:sugar/nucleoside kinase (ribokinase family)
MGKAPMLVGVGTATMDLVGAVPRHPEPDGRVVMSSVSLQGGGAVATALCAARALGCRARMAGKVADDDFGRFVRRGLRDAGVDVEHLRTAPGQLSPLSFIAVADAGRRRASYVTAGDVPPLTADELDLTALLDDARALIVDGEHADAQVAAAEEARERGVSVVFDASVLGEGAGELLALADVLVASERFAAETAPRGEVEDSLVELQRMGPKTVVVTLGSAGSIGLVGDTLVRQPAFEVDVVDTTGVGDVYCGVVAAALAMQQRLDRAMELASGAAALKCRALGGRAGIPELDELLAFLGWGTLEG